MNNPTRVVRPENGNDTVSEGIGYGMLLSVYMGDKTLFDGLYSYWTSHSAGGNASMLMTWCIPAGAGSCPATGGSATDADEDVAFALVQAGKQWGGTYANTAAMMIKQIFAVEIDGGSMVPKGGSNFNSTTPTNPSYFAPAYYRVFATVDTTNGDAWNRSPRTPIPRSTTSLPPSAVVSFRLGAHLTGRISAGRPRRMAAPTIRSISTTLTAFPGGSASMLAGTAQVLKRRLPRRSSFRTRTSSSGRP